MKKGKTCLALYCTLGIYFPEIGHAFHVFILTNLTKWNSPFWWHVVNTGSFLDSQEVNDLLTSMIWSQEAYMKTKEINGIKSNMLPWIAVYLSLQLPQWPDSTLFLTQTKEAILHCSWHAMNSPFFFFMSSLNCCLTNIFSNWILYIILVLEIFFQDRGRNSCSLRIIYKVYLKYLEGLKI